MFLVFLSGAFLVPYVLFLLSCGIPMFLLETAMGQFTSQGCITCWRHFCPLFEGLCIKKSCVIQLVWIVIQNSGQIIKTADFLFGRSVCFFFFHHFLDIYSSQILKRDNLILGCLDHPLMKEFQLLPQEHCFRAAYVLFHPYVKPGYKTNVSPSLNPGIS